MEINFHSISFIIFYFIQIEDKLKNIFIINFEIYLLLKFQIIQEPFIDVAIGGNQIPSGNSGELVVWAVTAHGRVKISLFANIFFSYLIEIEKYVIIRNTNFLIETFKMEFRN